MVAPYQNSRYSWPLIKLEAVYAVCTFHTLFLGFLQLIWRSVPRYAKHRKVTKDADGYTLEIAPLLGQSSQSLSGMAPVVQRAAHLSLCYPSRLPSADPAQLVPCQL